YLYLLLELDKNCERLTSACDLVDTSAAET
ncbi:hypothetical protein RRG08_066282, partial [Elysia crispata]